MSADARGTTEPPSNLQSLEAQSRNLANRAAVPHQRFARRIAVVALADMLRAMPDTRPVLKGGSALMLRFGPNHRPVLQGPRRRRAR